MTQTTVLLASAFALLFVVVFGAIELIKRKFGASPEVMRRIAHMASGFLLILDYVYLPQAVFVALVAAGGITFYVLSRFKLLTSVNEVSRRTVGQYVLTLGYLAAYFISLSDLSVFIPTVLIVSLADSLAGLAGTIAKSQTKTTFGSLVFFAVALILLLATGSVTVLPALVIAAALAIVERITPLGFDNVTVPIASALLLLAF